MFPTSEHLSVKIPLHWKPAELKILILMSEELWMDYFEMVKGTIWLCCKNGFHISVNFCRKSVPQKQEKIYYKCENLWLEDSKKKCWAYINCSITTQEDCTKCLTKLSDQVGQSHWMELQLVVARFTKAASYCCSSTASSIPLLEKATLQHWYGRCSFPLFLHQFS